MSLPPLADDSARHSIRSELDRSLFVEAGAGTGKTSELVRRIVAVITGGKARIDQIVAITFTEAAAGELRERVRHGLAQAALADAKNQKLCEEALNGLDDAPIQTIHAFAKRILSRHPTEVGLPPVFDVHDQVTSRLQFDRRWRRFLSETLASSTPLPSDTESMLRLSLALGLEVRHIRQLSLVLEQSWHRLDSADTTADPLPVMEVDRLLQHARRAVGAKGACSDASNKIYLALLDVEQWISQVEDAQASGTPQRIVEAVRSGPKLKLGNAKRKGVWPEDVCADIEDALEQMAVERDELLIPIRQYALQGLVSLCSRFALDGVAARVSAGTLDFHDLLVFARNLIRDHADIRSQLRSAYRYVMVDEFQDTDPLQAEIVTSLAEGRSLFVVGDPKQSIYRFRKADPAQYSAVKSQMGGSVVGLTSNFRTLPPLVQWINEVFEPVLLPSMGDGWRALNAGRNTDTVSASVHLVGAALPRGQINSAAMRTKEAGELVALLAEAQQNKWAIGAGSGRPARYGDMAVLMPTRTSLPALERAFREAAVPYRVESRSLIWSTQEIRDVVSVLRSIDDPGDEVSTVAALRSAALHCTDRDLLDWVTAGGSWDYTSDIGTVGGPLSVATGLQRLSALHEQRQWVTVPDLVSHVLREFRFFELAFALPRQRESWSRLRFLEDRARSWFEEGGAALHDFVLWCRAQADEGADALESVLPDADDDAVRVMTIHASKGLEFPIVALTGLGSIPNRWDAAAVLWPDDGRPEVRLGSGELDWKTPGFPEAETAEKRLGEEEQLRVLYVGATRARDHLLVGVNHIVGKGGENRSLAAKLLRAAGEVEHPTRQHVDWPPSSDALAPESMPSPAVDSAQRRAEVIARASAPAARSATAIAKLLNADTVHLPRKGLPTGDAGMDDLAERLAFGRAVHAGLEMMNPNNEGDLSGIAAEVADAEELGARVDEVEHCLAMTVKSRLWQEAAASGRWWREVAVTSAIGETVVEGYVDFVYEREDGLVVVDYKTDPATSPEDVAALVQRYRWQLLTYAHALQSSLGKPVVEAALLLISPDNPEALIAPIGDVSAGIAELHQALLSTP